MGDFKGSSTNVTTINATLVTADDLEVDSTKWILSGCRG